MYEDMAWGWSGWSMTWQVLSTTRERKKEEKNYWKNGEREQMTTKRRLGGKGNQELAGAGVRQIVTRRGCEMVWVWLAARTAEKSRPRSGQSRGVWLVARCPGKAVVSHPGLPFYLQVLPRLRGANACKSSVRLQHHQHAHRPSKKPSVHRFFHSKQAYYTRPSSYQSPARKRPSSVAGHPESLDFGSCPYTNLLNIKMYTLRINCTCPLPASVDSTPFSSWLFTSTSAQLISVDAHREHSSSFWFAY